MNRRAALGLIAAGLSSRAFARRGRGAVASGGSSSALAAYLAGAASGWSPRSDATGGFPMPTLTQALVTGGDVGTIFEYSATGCWDAAHRQMRFVGETHDNDHYAAYVVYDDASNAWSSPAAPWMGTAGNPTHAYQLNCTNPATGDHFVRQYLSDTVYCLPYGGSWTTLTNNDPIAEASDIRCQIWNPAANGGAGEMIVAGVFGVARYRYTVGSPASGTWTTLASSTPWSDNYYFTGFYDPLSQSIFVFHNSDTARCLEITVAGVVSTVSLTVPHPVGPIQADSVLAVPVDGYTTPGSVVRKPLLLLPGTSTWEFDSTGPTFDDLSIAPPATSGSVGIYVPISTYDAVLFVMAQDNLVPYTYLFNRQGT